MSGQQVQIPALEVRLEPASPVSPHALDALLRTRIEQELRERSDEYVTVAHGGQPRVDTAKLQALVTGVVERAIAEHVR